MRIRPSSTLARYGLAVGLVALAEQARRSLPGPWEPFLWFAPYLVAVAISAWVGGFGPGFVSTVGSSWMVSYFLLRPATSMSFTGATDTFSLVLFFGFCLLVNILCSSNRADTIARR